MNSWPYWQRMCRRCETWWSGVWWSGGLVRNLALSSPLSAKPLAGSPVRRMRPESGADQSDNRGVTIARRCDHRGPRGKRLPPSLHVSHAIPEPIHLPQYHGDQNGHRQSPSQQADGSTRNPAAYGATKHANDHQGQKAEHAVLQEQHPTNPASADGHDQGPGQPRGQYLRRQRFVRNRTCRRSCWRRSISFGGIIGHSIRRENEACDRKRNIRQWLFWPGACRSAIRRAGVRIVAAPGRVRTMFHRARSRAASGSESATKNAIASC
jgi:hypothetical protein